MKHKRTALISKLANSTGVKEEDVAKVLESIGAKPGGLTRVLASANEQLSPKAVDSMSITELRLAIKTAAGVILP